MKFMLDFNNIFIGTIILDHFLHRLTIAEEGCARILNNKYSNHILINLCKALGLDETGKSPMYYLHKVVYRSLSFSDILKCAGLGLTRFEEKWPGGDFQKSSSPIETTNVPGREM